MDNEDLPTNQHQFLIEFSLIGSQCQVNDARIACNVMEGKQSKNDGHDKHRLLTSQVQNKLYLVTSTDRTYRKVSAGAEPLKSHLPDDVSVNTASVWPPTDCMVNGCSRGADTVLFSPPPYTVRSSFRVKDTCIEQRC